MNDTGAQLHDNKGMAEGGLLNANEVGTQLYDFKGMSEGFLGTSGGTVATPYRSLMGVGL